MIRSRLRYIISQTFRLCLAWASLEKEILKQLFIMIIVNIPQSARNGLVLVNIRATYWKITIVILISRINRIFSYRDCLAYL